MKKALLLATSILAFVVTSFGQIDQEFWFAAPEVSFAHADRPIILRLTTFDEAAEITVSMPANPAFVPIQVNLAAGSHQSVFLTDWIDLIENVESDQIVNKGLLISSTTPISAYYEVKGTSGFGVNNTEIYALKGQNALGLEFFTPFQTIDDKRPTLPDAFASADIVATEDSTNIIIVPTNDVVGHLSGDTIRLLMNRGETYSLRALGIFAVHNISGSYIQSDKPIAVSTKDDSVVHQGDGGWDLIGDQLTPVEKVGTEYIIGNGWGYLVATEDNTVVEQSGVQVGVLSRGETMFIDNVNLVSYIKTSKPAYLFQTQVVGRELGGALIPAINCTGSSKISFTRSTNEVFEMILLVPTGAEDGFVLNNGTINISANQFEVVNGTNGEWQFAQIDLTNSVPVEEASVIFNDQAVFHLGIINGGGSTGNKYGYFSNFGSLELGIDVITCSDEEIILDAGIGKDSYLWSTGETTQTITATVSDTFWVAITEGDCDASDTVAITFNPRVEIDLGDDQLICELDTLEFDLTGEGNFYRWSTGDTVSKVSISDSIVLGVYVENEYGCSDQDTVVISTDLVPDLQLPADEIVCFGDSLEVLVDEFEGLIWDNDSTYTSRNLFESGTYWVMVDNTCGLFSDSMDFVVDTFREIDLGPNREFCEGGSVEIGLSAGFDAHLWSTGETTALIDVDSEGKFILEATNEFGCVADDTIRVHEILEPSISLVPDTLICEGDTLKYEVDKSYSTTWSTGDTLSVLAVVDSGTYSVVVTTEAEGQICGVDDAEMHVGFWNISAPNIITPNGDGKNETLRAEGINEFGRWRLNVYTRWGNVVYNSEDFQNDWQQVDINDGTYFYELTEPGATCTVIKSWLLVVR